MSLTPVLVYGTLRSGQSNERVIAPYSLSHEIVVLKNAEMYDLTGCPTILTGIEDSHIIAELHYLDPNLYEAGMRALDSLEGFIHEKAENIYDRILVNVKNSSGETVEAFVYVAGVYLREEDGTVSAPVIPTGDWTNRTPIVFD